MIGSAAPQFYARLSILAALLTIGLKWGAYWLTGSVGLFSDATEAIVNLVAALIAWWMLIIAARPPDDVHTFGHTKAEYFASAAEGALIMLAAVSIGLTAWHRIWHPQSLQQLDLGLILALVAAAINGSVAYVLLQAGRRMRLITLQASAQHLFTDVWTTGGVVVGILLAQFTGWLVLDPLIAIGVAVHIVWIGWRLLQETGDGLLDSSLPDAELADIKRVLRRFEQDGIVFHALRTRRAGTRRFISVHVLVPGDWSVKQGHDLCEQLELQMIKTLPDTHMMTHLEPIEDPSAWQDAGLDRE